MAHDFVNFPELTNAQMNLYYFESPHKQIMDDFFCKVVKVVDGDTIRVKWEERDFDFPIRLLDIEAPEMNEPRGKFVRSWLEKKIEGEEVEIIVDPSNRVEKWGRLLGKVFHSGMDIGQEMMDMGLVIAWEARHAGEIEDLDEVLK